jgi:hypothetical protein
MVEKNDGAKQQMASERRAVADLIAQGAKTLTLGAASMLLSRWSTRQTEPDFGDDFARLAPYASVAEGILSLYAGVLGLVFSPVVLLFQALPPARTSDRVVPA